MTQPWAFDELAHAGAEHLDTDYARTYDTKAGVDAAPALEALRRHGIDRAATVVDLGAGTGTLAVALAALCRRVVAVDVSPAMLDVARRTVEAAGTGNVELVRAGFLTYDHAGPPADAVCTRNALHQLPDFWKAVALQRVARMLRPGGVLWLRDLVYSFGPHEVDARFAAWLAAAPDDPAVGWTAAELATHIRTEHSTFDWLLEAMLDRTGFDVVEKQTPPAGTHATYVCRRRAVDGDER